MGIKEWYERVFYGKWIQGLPFLVIGIGAIGGGFVVIAERNDSEPFKLPFSWLQTLLVSWLWGWPLGILSILLGIMFVLGYFFIDPAEYKRPKDD